MKGVKNSSWTI